MAKNKIEEKGVIVQRNENGELVLTSENNEELICENLTNGIMELAQEFGSLNIVVKDHVVRNCNNERKPTFKYVCEVCGSEIKAKMDDLHVIHEECSKDGKIAKFILVEK